MDTKYFQQALAEWRNSKIQPAPAAMTVGEMTLGQLSWLLLRAQELKDADSLEAQRRGRENALNRMGA